MYGEPCVSTKFLNSDRFFACVRLTLKQKRSCIFHSFDIYFFLSFTLLFFRYEHFKYRQAQLRNGLLRLVVVLPFKTAFPTSVSIHQVRLGHCPFKETFSDGPTVMGWLFPRWECYFRASLYHFQELILLE